MLLSRFLRSRFSYRWLAGHPTRSEMSTALYQTVFPNQGFKMNSSKLMFSKKYPSSDLKDWENETFTK